MSTEIFNDPALTIAIALVAGMAMQILAHHIRVPGIVLLLLAGVALGPDGAGIVRPEALGQGLNTLIGFAVAIILFEGGLTLKFSRLKRAQRSIRQLVLFGGLATVIGAAIAVRFIMHWPWENSLLFGTLVMVTGPTVINPLLKRIKVKRTVATVLEAEGVLIDAVGAVVAIVALEATLSSDLDAQFAVPWHIVSRLGFGAVAGSVAGMVLILLQRFRRLIPEGIENVFTLSVVLALFQVSNTILPESGIAAVVAAGIVTGNWSKGALGELMKFKEELTILLIAMLFVLLAADVRVERIMSLGWPAVGVVLLLMFVIRPAAVLLGTAKSKLKWPERVFIAWIGPRGIVAAAVAAFFASAFNERGLPGGNDLRALVFMVIAITVLVAGITGGWLAGLLKVRRPRNDGWVVLGASSLARGLAKLFREVSNDTVVLMDTNMDHCKAAEADCTRVIHGNGLEPKYLQLAETDTRRGAIALTSNDEVNYLFIRRARDESREISRYAALKSTSASLTINMLQSAGVECLFGMPTDVEAWNHRFESKQVLIERWQFNSDPSQHSKLSALLEDYGGSGLIAAAVQRGSRLSPVGHNLILKAKDEVHCFVYASEQDAIHAYLNQLGWKLLGAVDKESYSTSSCE